MKRNGDVAVESVIERRSGYQMVIRSISSRLTVSSVRSYSFFVRAEE